MERQERPGAARGAPEERPEERQSNGQERPGAGPGAPGSGHRRARSELERPRERHRSVKGATRVAGSA